MRNSPNNQRDQVEFYDIDPKDDDSLINFICGQWDIRENRYGGLYTTWLNTIAAYQGFFHLEYDIAKKNYLDKTHNDPPWRTNLAINLLLPRIRTNVAKLLKTRPIFDVLPASNEISDIDTAFLGKRFLQGIWYQNNFNYKFMDFLYWLSLTGVAYSNPYWHAFSGQTIDVTIENFLNQDNLKQAIQSGDPVLLEAIVEDTRKDYEAFLRKNGGDPTIFIGDVKWNIPSPFDIITSECTDFEEKEWLIHANIRPLSYYKTLGVDTEEFGTASDRDRQYIDMSRRINMMSVLENYALHQQGLSVQDLGKEDVVELSLWVPPNNKFKKGFYCVVAGGQKVLRKGPNPYEHRMVPFAMAVAEKVPGKVHGFSAASQAIPEIKAYNAAKSAIVEMTKAMGGNKWLVHKNAKVAAITNEVGEIIRWEGVVPPTPAPMPNPPRVFFDLMMSNIRDVDEITAQREATRGQNPAGGRSAALVQNLQAVDEGSLNVIGLTVDTVMAQTGRMMLSIGAQFISEDRMMSYAGENNKHVAFVLRSGSLKGMYYGVPGADYYNVRVTLWTQFGLDRGGQQETLKSLLQYGVFRPEDRDKIFHWLDMGWFGDEVDEHKRDRSVAHRENLMMAQGQQIMPSVEQNQDVHVREHLAYMNGEDFRALPPQIQMNYRLHVYYSIMEQAKNITRPQLYAQAAQFSVMGEIKELTGIDMVQVQAKMMAMSNEGQNNAEGKREPAAASGKN